jgi:hypothetical protein
MYGLNGGVGLFVENLDLAAAVVLGLGGDVWLSAKAESDFVGLVGLPFLDLSVQKAELAINTASNGRTIDFSKKNLAIPVGLGGNVGGI